MASCSNVSIQWRRVGPTEMRSMFLLFDQNDDQTILVQDLGTIMRALGQYPTDSEVKSLIDEIDADGKYRRAPTKTYLRLVYFRK